MQNSPNSQTDPDWLAVAAEQLMGIKGKWADMKRATIIALVDARLAQKAESEVWDREKHPEVCSKTVYYKWLKKDKKFKEALETVTKLAKEWRASRALRALQQAAEKMALASPLAADQLVSIATAGQVRRARAGAGGKPVVFTEPAPTADVLRAAVALLDRAGMQTAAKSVQASAALDADQLAALLAQAKVRAAEIDQAAADGWNPSAEPDGEAGGEPYGD